MPEVLRNALTKTLNKITSEESYTDYKEIRGDDDFLWNHIILKFISSTALTSLKFFQILSFLMEITTEMETIYSNRGIQ